MSPLYDYHCERCGLRWEAANTVSDRDDEVCICGKIAERKLSVPSKPVVYEYYSENLETVITGPAQRKKVMKERDVEEIG